MTSTFSWGQLPSKSRTSPGCVEDLLEIVNNQENLALCQMVLQ